MHPSKVIFTVTTGRSGSDFLCKVLNCFNNILSEHEPRPKYDKYIRHAQHFPFVARDFIFRKKLPYLEKKTQSGKIYAETSHLICKGFLDEWICNPELPTPKLIILNRELRKIALSFNRINSIPGRTFGGVRYLLSPDDPNNLTLLPNHEKLNNYQICYWYCLEIEERKKYYRDLIKKHKGVYCDTSIEELKTSEGINHLQETLQLPKMGILGQRKYRKTINTIVNPKTDKKPVKTFTHTELEELEQEVANALIIK